MGSFRALIRDAYAVAGWRLPLLVVVTFASALLEGATIAALLPLLAKSAGGQGGASDAVSRFLEGLLGFLGLPATTAGVAILIGILESFASFWSSTLKESIVFAALIPILIWRSFLHGSHESEEEDEDIA